MRTWIAVISVSAIQTSVSPAIGLGALGGKRVPLVSSGVVNRRPELSMSSAQNGSVPSARRGSAVETLAESAVTATALESAEGGRVSPHAASTKVNENVIRHAPTRRQSSATGTSAHLV